METKAKALDNERAELVKLVSQAKAAVGETKLAELEEMSTDAVKQTLAKTLFAAELGQKKLAIAKEKFAEGTISAFFNFSSVLVVQ